MRDGFVDGRAIVGEICEHGDSCGKSDDGDDVRFSHLLLDEFLRGVMRADQVVGLHGRYVEEKDDEAAIAQLIADCFRRGRVRPVIINWHDNGLSVLCSRGFDAFYVRVRKTGNILPLAIIRDDELVRAQSLDRLAGLVCHFDVNANQIR